MKNKKCTISFYKIWQICRIIVLIAVVSAIWSCEPPKGWFIESSFYLAPESRLPKWLPSLPSNYSQSDLRLKIDFYGHPFFGKVRMTVNGPAPDHKELMSMVGTQRYHPFTEQQKYDFYPRYIIIRIGNIEEVFEHKQRDDILYITDNPTLTEVLKNSAEK